MVDENAASPLGEKFGCSLTVAKSLLDQALSMGLTVVGVRYELMHFEQHADIQYPWNAKIHYYQGGNIPQGPEG